MIKKTAVLAIVLGLLMAVLSPVSAQAEIATSGASASVVFPSSIDFNLAIESGVEITDVRLHYIVERQGFAKVTSEVIIDIVPGTPVTASWTWDMVKTGGMPSGTVIDYWWTIADAEGNTYITTRQQVSFDDNRYSWQSLTENNISLYWYYGGESFARELMAAAQAALVKLARDTGAALEKPVRVYIYADSYDLQGAMIFAQEWTGGVAYTREGVIAIGISPSNLEWGKRAIVHELAHLVTEQMTSNPYNSIPNWLNEGISMYAEGEMEPAYRDYLEQAVAQDSLITVRSLASPFSAYAEKSYLSYAQSYSIVGFLIDSYGQEKMFKLLSAFKQGSSYDGALLSVYGFDMDGLNALWRGYADEKYQTDGNGVSLMEQDGIFAEEGLWS
jgi:hypothetical protein